MAPKTFFDNLLHEYFKENIPFYWIRATCKVYERVICTNTSKKTFCFIESICKVYEWVSVIYHQVTHNFWQLYHEENMLHFDDDDHFGLNQHTLLDFYSASSLKLVEMSLHSDTVQVSRWRAIRAKKSPCGCSLRFVLVPKEKWKSPCNFTKSLC